MKFNEAQNQEICFKRYSWERKKTLQDVLGNANKQRIQVSSVNILEDYARKNPSAKFVFAKKQ